MGLVQSRSILQEGICVLVDVKRHQIDSLFYQAESFLQPTGGQSVVGDYVTGTLGTSGPILISLPNHNTSYYTKVVDIARDKTLSGITYNQDVNDGTPLGLGTSSSTSL